MQEERESHLWGEDEDAPIEMPPDPVDSPGTYARAAADAAHEDMANKQAFADGLGEADWGATKAYHAAREAADRAAAENAPDAADLAEKAQVLQDVMWATKGPWDAAAEHAQEAWEVTKILDTVADSTSAIDEAYREGQRAAEEEAANNNAFEGASAEAEGSAEVDWF